MKILHYHRNIRLEKGGVVRFVLDVCAAMAARGHEVTLASPDITDVPAAWTRGASGMPGVVQLPAPLPRLGVWGPAGMHRARAALAGVDVAHLHGAWMPTNVQLGRAAERLGVPYVMSPHGMLDDWCTSQSASKKRLFHALAGKRLFTHAAAVHCTAQAELDQSQKWFPGARTAVIPLLIDMDQFRTPPGPEEARSAFPRPLARAPTVLFLSRLHPKKGVEVLIDAVAALKSRGVDCNLLIAGSGDGSYAAALGRRVGERGITDRTRFLGMVTGRLKVSLFQSADVLALPTSQENFGLALAEAMACGVPAVTTKGVDIWPELEASGGAVLCEAMPEAFAAALERVLGDPGARARLSDAARAWAAGYLDPRSVALQYERLYDDIRRRAGEAVTA